MGDEANVWRKEECQGEGEGQGAGTFEQRGTEDNRLSGYKMGWRECESFCLVRIWFFWGGKIVQS